LYICDYFYYRIQKRLRQKRIKFIFFKKKIKKLNLDYFIAEQRYAKKEKIIQTSDGLVLYSNQDFQKSKLYNISAKAVKTKYICFLDADVILDFNFILENLNDQDLIRPFDKVIYLSEDQSNNYINKSELPQSDYFEDDYWGKYSILIKKDLFNKTEGFDERIKGWGWEDLDFVHNKLKNREPYVIKSNGYHLWHPKSNKQMERKNFFFYKENASFRKKLSFCTSIKNRKFQIEQTLQKNISDNIENSDDIEFTICDFNSNDNVSEWVINNFKDHLQTGYLKLFKIFDFRYWHASVAKNTTHYLSEGEILVNLDCDNFTGKNGGKYLIDLYEQNKSINFCHQWCRKDWFSGNYGRISFRRDVFESLGGYDEKFSGMGYQDTDILKRAEIMYPDSLINLSEQTYNNCLFNDKDLSIANLDKKQKDKGFFRINSENESLSIANINSNKLTANNGVYGIRFEVRYFDCSKDKFHPVCA